VKAGIVKLRDDLPFFITADTESEELVIETTGGADAHSRSNRLFLGFGAPIKGAGMSVFKVKGSVSPFTRVDELIAEFAEWYGWTEKTSTPTTGRLPVIFSPGASFLYLLPLWAGVEGDAIEKKTSPLSDRVGEQILSERLSVIDDPLASTDPGSRSFDDEGTPCQRRAIVEKGILKGSLLDLRTAAALGQASTGNAVKRELFGSGTETKPNPWPINLTVAPGSVPYREMIAGLEEGLLVYYGMGFHSGNYPQGKFSVQAVGFHIKDGVVVGRLDRTMVAGDIYKDFKHVRAVSSERGRPLSFLGGLTPYVLVDSLQVAGA